MCLPESLLPDRLRENPTSSPSREPISLRARRQYRAPSGATPASLPPHSVSSRINDLRIRRSVPRVLAGVGGQMKAADVRWQIGASGTLRADMRRVHRVPVALFEHHRTARHLTQAAFALPYDLPQVVPGGPVAPDLPAHLAHAHLVRPAALNFRQEFFICHLRFPIPFRAMPREATISDAGSLCSIARLIASSHAPTILRNLAFSCTMRTYSSIAGRRGSPSVSDARKATPPISARA